MKSIWQDRGVTAFAGAWVLVLSSLFAGVAQATQDSRDAKPAPTTLQLYDVRDVAERLATQAGSAREDMDEPARVEAGTALLVKTIRETCDPPLDFEDDIRAMKGTLVVRANSSTHQWIQTLLGELRTSWERLIHLEVPIFVVDEAAVATLGQDFQQPLVGAGEEAAAVMKRLDGTRGVERVSTQALTLFPLGNGTVSLLRRVTYVSDYRVMSGVLPVEGDLVIPQVEHFDEGLVVKARVVPNPDDSFVVDLEVEQHDLLQPSPTKQTEHGPVLEPVTETRRVSSRVTMKEGGFVLFPAGRRNGELFLVGLRIRSVIALDDLKQNGYVR